MGNLFSTKQIDPKTLIKRNYFSLVEQSRKMAYFENESSILNQIISFQKKDFKKIPSGHRLKVNTDEMELFINWKVYLILYLEEEDYCGKEWAHNLLKYVKKENFSNQIKYQSDFFFEEFRLMTSPKNFKIIRKRFEEERQDSYCFGNSINDSEISKDYNKYNLSICNNFMTSFSSFNDSFFKNPNENTSNKIKIKEYISIFKKHLFNNMHPIYNIILNFSNEYEKVIQEQINIFHNSYHNDDYQTKLVENTESIIEEIRNFIIEMQVVVKLFYSKTISLQFFKDEKDEFLNIITSLIFKTGNLYNAMFQLFKIRFKEEVDLIDEKMQKFKNIKPEEMGVKEKFCLNQVTLNYQKSLKSQKMVLKEMSAKPKEENDDSETQNNLNINEEISTAVQHFPENSENSNKELLITSDSSRLKEISQKLTQDKPVINISEPYYEAIDLIKTLETYQAPFEKLVIIASISSMITESVNEFWKGMEDSITPSLLKIDADELMNIYIYIIVHSKYSDIVIHAAFVRLFTTPITKTSMMGYYFSTLEGSIDYLKEIKKKEDFTSDGLPGKSEGIE